jgi:hypothetical protein
MSSTVPLRTGKKLAPVNGKTSSVDKSKNNEEWKEKLSKMNLKKSYHGDTWGSRGPYDEGLLYLSRMSVHGSVIASDIGAVVKSEDAEIKSSLDSSMAAADSEKLRAKKRCAAALCSLSWDKGFESQIVSEGGLKALISLSGLKDTQSQRVGCIYF